MRSFCLFFFFIDFTKDDWFYYLKPESWHRKTILWIGFRVIISTRYLLFVNNLKLTDILYSNEKNNQKWDWLVNKGRTKWCMVQVIFNIDLFLILYNDDVHCIVVSVCSVCRISDWFCWALSKCQFRPFSHILSHIIIDLLNIAINAGIHI